MRVLSIIGIVLFTWLFFNRCEYYVAVVNYTGKSITYTEDVMTKAKHNILPQIFVGAYALIYAIVGTVYSFKKSKFENSEKNLN